MSFYFPYTSKVTAAYFPPLIISLICLARRVPPFHLLAAFFLATPESIPWFRKSSTIRTVFWAVHHASSTSLTGPINVPLRIAQVWTVKQAGRERPGVMLGAACLAVRK
jgi:hypothetical protein